MFSVHELAQDKVEKANHNHETYKMLYEQCIKRIRHAHRNDCTETTWQVPAMVFGRGLFEHSHAIRYVKEKLSRGKFEAEDIGNGLLHITWGTSLKKAVKESSKLQQAPKQQKPPASKTTGSGSSNKEPLSKKLQRLTLKLKP